MSRRSSGETERVLIVLLLATWAAGAQGATLRVPAEHPTIQAAVSLALPGDTVLVAPGVYTNPGGTVVDFHGKEILIRSEAGAEQTIIERQGAGGSVLVLMREGETRSTILDGFTVRGALDACGVLVAGSSPLIRSCLITLNSAEGTTIGGGAVVAYASPRFEDCTFSQNYGGGVYVQGGAAELARCRFVQNALCGVWCEQATLVRLEGCLIEANQGSELGVGGGVWGYESQVVIENSAVVRNRAAYGGGLGIGIGCQLDIKGSTIAGNTAMRSGGGIYADPSSVSIRTSILRDNCASDVTDLLTSGSVVVECSAIQRDHMDTRGSGSIELIGPQVPEDPRFCDAWPCPAGIPSPGGDYQLRSDSPCLPQFSPCGELIGAFGEGCVAPVPIGACCLLDGTCVLHTNAACVAAGGLYQGDGEGCYPEPCVPMQIEVTSWGGIKAINRLRVR